jgi:hypothetical protein
MVALVVLGCRLAGPAFADGEVPAQTVIPLTPQAEQRVEPLAPVEEQRVETLDQQDEQRVLSPDNPGPIRRGFGAVGKAALVVVAAGLSIAVMAASLLLI